MSTNGRLLQSLGIAQPMSLPGNRRNYLRLSGDSSSALLNLGLRRMRSMHMTISEMRFVLRGRGSSATGARLRRMAKLYEVAIAQVESVLRKWNSGRDER